MASSVPTIEEFDPRVIPWQFRVIKDIRKNFSYTDAIQEVLLSGSVGSAKSLLMAHIIVTHCLENENAVFGIGRKAMPYLKGTLIDMIKKHLGTSIPYRHNKQSGEFEFPNGSKILAFSWDDGDYKKVRSFEFSGFAIEELTENEDKEIYDEIRMRIRLGHVKERLLISATNPDEPDHWAYKYFIESKNPNIHVYYSLTRQNPFLPKGYYESQAANLDPRMAMRMLEGKWLSIRQDVIYYEYDKQRNFVNDAYTLSTRLPLHITFDFNIGVGKPMSCALYQIRDNLERKTKEFHIFDNVIVEGARTADIMEEIAGRGYLDLDMMIAIHGDATGKHSDTRSRKTDYEIIRDFLANYETKSGKKIVFMQEVPAGNPPIRTRHNLVNAHCFNKNGDVRLKIYRKADVADEGMRLTKLKDRGQYIEDDSKYYQHVTTAIGYGIYWESISQNSKKQGSVQL